MAQGYFPLWWLSGLINLKQQKSETFQLHLQRKGFILIWIIFKIVQFLHSINPLKWVWTQHICEKWKFFLLKASRLRNRGKKVFVISRHRFHSNSSWHRKNVFLKIDMDLLLHLIKLILPRERALDDKNV